MKRTNKSTRFIVESALIAGIYAAVTYFVAPISFGAQQFRVSEALTVLPILTPAAIPGLTIGCLLSNLNSPLGLIDIVCGTLATLLAAICTRCTRNICIKNLPLLSVMFPVLFNGIIIGLELSVFLPEGFTVLSFLTVGASVAFGEAVVCFVLGIPLFIGLKRTKVFER